MTNVKPFRVLLDLTELRIPCFKYVWISVCPKEVKTIADLKFLIIDRISLDNSDIILFLRDGLLLEKETIMVLREDDIVRIQYVTESIGHSNVGFHSSTENKVKRKSSEYNAQNSLSSSKRHKNNFVSFNSNETSFPENENSNIDDNTNITDNVDNTITYSKIKKKKNRSSDKKLSIVDTEGLECTDIQNNSCESNSNKYVSFASSQEITMFDSIQDGSVATSIVCENDKPPVLNGKGIQLMDKVSAYDYYTNSEDAQDKTEYSSKESKVANLVPSEGAITKQIIPVVTDEENILNKDEKSDKKKRRRRRSRKSTSLQSNENCDTEVQSIFSAMSPVSEPAKGIHIRYISPPPFKDSAKTSDVNEINGESMLKNTNSLTYTLNEENFQTTTDCSSLFPKVSTPATENESEKQRIAFKKNCNLLFKENLHEDSVAEAEKSSFAEVCIKSENVKVCKYSDYPPLNYLPQCGTHIAFKILELGSSYCPEISEYKEGIVRKILTDTGDIEIELIKPEVVSVRTGKFECIKEEELEELANKKIEKTKEVVNWGAVIEPRIVTK